VRFGAFGHRVPSIPPLKLLPWKRAVRRFVSWRNDGGTAPYRWALRFTYNDSKSLINPISVGSVPVNRFLFTFKCFRCSNFAKELLMVPVNELSKINND